jgi:hypothetical protein
VPAIISPSVGYSAMSTGAVFALVAAATSWNCGLASSDGMC